MLEEKILYYAQDRKTQRQEGPRRFVLTKISHEDEDEPLLPISSNSPNALKNSPLAAWLVNPESTTDDSAAACMDVLGPWELEASVPVPGPESHLKFSSSNAQSYVNVSHVLKVVVRVDRGDDEYLDNKGKRRKWDIIVESPAHILHVSLAVVPSTESQLTCLLRLAAIKVSCCLNTPRPVQQ